VLLREASLSRRGTMARRNVSGRDDGGEFLTVGELRREGFVISSVTLQIVRGRVVRARVVYYRSVHSWRNRIETVLAAELSEEERQGG